ncbi:MAG: ribbon-helix-helix protein, CopG family [Acidobacteria bacterium]|nr:ribbon-helix-helix protein, CopG family [Acidobacteriota bacterium]
MSNITLRVDDEVLKAVRRHAAERETTVNHLVREFLDALAAREGRAAEVRRRMRELSEGSSARIGPRTWSRDDLHEG